MSGQTKKGSFIESATNLVADVAIGVVSQLIIFPLVGIDVSLGTNFIIVGWFTVVNWLRVYVIRRWFNTGTIRRHYEGPSNGQRKTEGGIN